MLASKIHEWVSEAPRATVRPGGKADRYFKENLGKTLSSQRSGTPRFQLLTTKTELFRVPTESAGAEHDNHIGGDLGGFAVGAR